MNDQTCTCQTDPEGCGFHASYQHPECPVARIRSKVKALIERPFTNHEIIRAMAIEDVLAIIDEESKIAEPTDDGSEVDRAIRWLTSLRPDWGDGVWKALDEARAERDAFRQAAMDAKTTLE